MRILSLAHLSAVALVLCNLAAPGPAQATRYHIVDLGANHIPTDLNDRGEVTGVFELGISARVLRQGHWRRLPCLSPPHCEQANAINEGGDVAGGSPPGFWPRGGEFTPIPVPPGSTGDGGAADISNNQLIVGGYSSSPGEMARCFRWSAAEGSVGLGLMGNGDFCEPGAINDAGQIVGGADIEFHGVAHAFIYENGTFRDLGTVDGLDTYATDINQNGHVVFGNMFTSFLWKNGHTIDLRDGTPYSEIYAASLNDHDELVGAALDASGNEHLVLIADGHVTELEPEIDNLGDWLLPSYDSFINNLGVIVGQGTRPATDHFVHGYMLVPIP